MIVECRHIYKTYKSGRIEFPALKDVNLSVEAGEYLAVMGPSGSGKSTLMNLIGCLDVPTEGTLLLDGEDVGKCSEDRMSDIRLYKVGFVFQTFHLLPRQTALENVELPLTYAHVSRAVRRERAMQALEKVDLATHAGHLPTELSGGQKQRTAIARAIINEPKILLADEPTGALDSASGEMIMDIFRELNRGGVTVIMITHDRDIAAHANRIVEIRDGVLRDSI